MCVCVRVCVVLCLPWLLIVLAKAISTLTDEIIKLLLEEAKMDPNAKNNDGDTPLHMACWNERSEQVQLLVRDERCNPHKKNSRGDTALHIACRLSNGGMILLVFTA